VVVVGPLARVLWLRHSDTTHERHLPLAVRASVCVPLARTRVRALDIMMRQRHSSHSRSPSFSERILSFFSDEKKPLTETYVLATSVLQPSYRAPSLSLSLLLSLSLSLSLVGWFVGSFVGSIRARDPLVPYSIIS